jgi:acyl-CoA synthetase (AMP-forming)/AMP-acid ligase II
VSVICKTTFPADHGFVNMSTATSDGWLATLSSFTPRSLLARRQYCTRESRWALPIARASGGLFKTIKSQVYSQRQVSISAHIRRFTTSNNVIAALRAIKRDDPENKCLKRVGEAGGLRSLKALFLAGERSEPSIITMYQELLQKYGAPGANVIDNWWSSESGSPISGISLVPHVGKDRKSKIRDHKTLQIKPGSAGKAMPGFDVRAVDDEGNEVKRGKMGNIVMAIPLAPTGFRTLWEDEERFHKGYLKRFDGKWIDTGDAGIIDADGYISIMSRSDDLINTAGHRLSTGKQPHHESTRMYTDTTSQELSNKP